MVRARPGRGRRLGPDSTMAGRVDSSARQQGSAGRCRESEATSWVSRQPSQTDRARPQPARTSDSEWLRGEEGAGIGFSGRACLAMHPVDFCVCGHFGGGRSRSPQRNNERKHKKPVSISDGAPTQRAFVVRTQRHVDDGLMPSLPWAGTDGGFCVGRAGVPIDRSRRSILGHAFGGICAGPSNLLVHARSARVLLLVTHSPPPLLLLDPSRSLLPFI